MTFSPSPRAVRGVIALVVVVMSLAFYAVPAFAQGGGGGGSVVTREDCQQGRIKTKAGRTLSQAECERLIGQRVSLAQTGFEAWLVGLAGLALVGGAGILLVRRRPGSQLA